MKGKHTEPKKAKQTDKTKKMKALPPTTEEEIHQTMKRVHPKHDHHSSIPPTETKGREKHRGTETKKDITEERKDKKDMVSVSITEEKKKKTTEEIVKKKEVPKVKRLEEEFYDTDIQEVDIDDYADIEDVDDTLMLDDIDATVSLDIA